MKKFVLTPVRALSLALVVAAGVAAIGFSTQPGRASAADGAARQPVLVELFTSEGCSSCPPADELLARLDATQPVEGAQAIVLSEHVTYWDHQGWRDPFSLEAMTDRQKQYSSRFGLEDVYTPQVVVDGATQMVGSDGPGLAQAVTRAAAAPKASLSILDARWDAGSVHFAVRSAGGDSKATLVAALAEDAVQSSVARGENAGRSLRHVAVVRVMQEMGKNSEDGRALTLKMPAVSQSGSPSGPVRLVVFLADRHNGHVLAVAEQTINRS
jgi:hypothetical protein